MFGLLGVMSMTWHLIPMAIVISLVYSATRYESSERILHRGTRMFLTILLAMGGIYLILEFLSPG